jgi:GH15 family glucan-1,4-alpha-glucosidase
MASAIEGYAFLSNRHGCALVSSAASVDWLCMPRFDSPACMAALLGRDEHGCWSIFPSGTVRGTCRRYRRDTLILETDFECEGGAVRVIDFMPFDGRESMIRIVEGLTGEVGLFLNLVVRFGHGAYKPWVTTLDDGDIDMVTAPNAVIVRTPVALKHDDNDVFGSFSVKAGERVPFELTWHAAHQSPAAPLDALAMLAATEERSREWVGRSKYHGAHADLVNQSLLVLKGMIYEPTGGIIAAPTAGLPEDIGGVRNWDYRYCWLRDAALTLETLMLGGYVEEATAWRQWLLNALAGAPEELQIMYGVDGERRLQEYEADWLPGYEESRPVHLRNAAFDQFQLDVYGEVVQALYEARRHGVPEARDGRRLAIRAMDFISTAWQRPDDGIWEMRSERRHFVHSKVSAWAAVDRFVRILDEFSAPDDPRRELLPKYSALRDRIHRDICEHGFDPRQNTFTQSYGRPELDASLLLLPGLGFLPVSDPRIQGTIAAIEKNLVEDGLVLRYKPEQTGDGLTGSEAAFLACSFWLVDVYAESGRIKDAEALFERIVSLRNDLGLLAEEYDTKRGRLVGNFPQAFSHLAMIHSASVLSNAAAR